jgi:membrane protein implicated in regulation of membrane protease activity
MYIIAIAWLFVVVLMAAAEAMSTSIVGGLLTLVFYGLLPLGIVLYLLGTPQRRRNQKKRAQEQALATAETASENDSHTPPV